MTWNEMLGIVKYNKKDLTDILSGSVRTNDRTKNRSKLVEKVEKILKYNFKYKFFLIQALTHSSYKGSNPAK